ncbi:MAG: CDP-diacylglycerol--serine O-phosphatidyltransferase [Bacteroidia bacterium]
MKAINRWIPNIITLGNLTCGMLACWCAAAFMVYNQRDFVHSEYYYYPSFFIFGAAILDFFDGLAARILKVNSELGKQLDSLADVVSFGVAPSFIILGYNLMGEYSFLGLFIGIFSCIRLAKFNIDNRQSNSFLGLPVPSTGIVIASLPFIDKSGPLAFMVNPWVVGSLVVLLCCLMVSELPLLALKFKNYNLKDNIFKYLVLFIGLVSLIIFQFQGLPLVILGYVLVSLIANYSVIKKT